MSCTGARDLARRRRRSRARPSRRPRAAGWPAPRETTATSAPVARASSSPIGSSANSAGRRRSAAGHRQRREPALLRGDEDQPRRRRLEREASARVCLAVKLRRAHLDRQRGQVVPGLRRDRPLHQPQVAGADHADPLGVPRLLADPAQRGQTVDALVERAEPALRAECPPHALHDDLQPPLGQDPSEDQAERAGAVRRASAPARSAAAGRARRACHPAVGQQHRAVVHRDAQVALADDVAGLRARQPHAPGEDRTPEAHGRRSYAPFARGSRDEGRRSLDEELTRRAELRRVVSRWQGARCRSGARTPR